MTFGADESSVAVSSGSFPAVRRFVIFLPRVCSDVTQDGWRRQGRQAARSRQEEGCV